MSKNNDENNGCIACCAFKCNNITFTPLVCYSETCCVSVLGYKVNNTIVTPAGCFCDGEYCTPLFCYSKTCCVSVLGCKFDQGCNGRFMCENTKLWITPAGCFCDEGCCTPVGCVYIGDLTKDKYDSVYFFYVCCRCKSTKTLKGETGDPEINEYINQNKIIQQDVYRDFNILFIPVEEELGPIHQLMTNEEILKKIKQ